ncbi:hypothetical protein Salat_2775000 [Sesamum alatum]|uniref:Uncharacterized protein n=1 Tax=Sesamum alatum TaxID=300844 RepID=A0AAE1XLI0_9LAMI|nr:hypothetical protein Salat_2775000 [Sesamum alatum]
MHLPPPNYLTIHLSLLEAVPDRPSSGDPHKPFTRQSPRVARLPSPALDVSPLRESIPALQVPGDGALRKPSQSRSTVRSRPTDPTTKIRTESSIDTRHRKSQKRRHAEDVPSRVSSPKRRKSDKGNKVVDDNEKVAGGGVEEPQSPISQASTPVVIFPPRLTSRPIALVYATNVWNKLER